MCHALKQHNFNKHLKYTSKKSQTSNDIIF